MNRFTAQGILTEALRGSDILVVCRARADLDEAFHLVESLADRVATVIRRSSGRQRIVIPGGTIHFVSRNTHGHRGVLVDSVYLDLKEDEVDERLLADLVPCVSSRRGEIVIA